MYMVAHRLFPQSMATQCLIHAGTPCPSSCVDAQVASNRFSGYILLVAPLLPLRAHGLPTLQRYDLSLRISTQQHEPRSACRCCAARLACAALLCAVAMLDIIWPESIGSSSELHTQCRVITCSFWLAASAAARRSLSAALSRAARFCAKSSSYSSCRTSLSRSKALQARGSSASAQ